MPVPLLVSGPLPESVPDSVKLLAPVAVRPPALSVIALLRVAPPMLAATPPPLAVIAALPKLASLSNWATPPLRVASPLISAPDRLQVPLFTIRCWKLT